MPDQTSTRPWRRLLILPPLILGAVLVALAIKSKAVPERVPAREIATAVRIIEVPSVPVVPRALGYGTVEPGRTWEAVAEVGGKVIEVHPDLKKGAILGAGSQLLRIDPTEYELAVAQIAATIRSVEAKLAELDVKEENTRAALAIEERSLELSNKDLERKRQLRRQDNVAQAAVDQEERTMLGRRLSVQTQRNALNLIPTERQSLEAELALDRAKLEQARLDLERTVITAPFDCRVAEVAAERTQFAAKGTVLARIDDIAMAEVSAQVPIEKMMNVVARHETGTIGVGMMAHVQDVLALEPLVRLRAGDLVVEWPGRVTRISDSIDPQTRTVGVVVAVDDPYRRARLGERPPLVKNMFVEVELRGAAREPRPVVPRSAVHDGRVYVVGAGDRLEKRPVTLAFSQTNFAVVADGLEGGERVVVSDLVPAMDGMRLAPEPDADAAARLVAEATGEGAVR